MKKLPYVVVSFMIPLLLTTMMIVGVMEEVVGGGLTTTANSMLAYAAGSSTNSSINITSQSLSLDNIETKKVRVGDMDIAYKIFGKVKPLLLVPGFSMTMDMWDPNMLESSAVIALDRKEEKLQLAEKFGADHVVNVSKSQNIRSEVTSKISEGKGSGVDVVIDCVGADATIEDSCRILNKGGSLVVVGLFW